MPSHVAGKPDNSHGATDQARLPGVCLIVPLQKAEACLFFSSFFLLLFRATQNETLRGLWDLFPNTSAEYLFLFGFGVV